MGLSFSLFYTNGERDIKTFSLREFVNDCHPGPAACGRGSGAAFFLTPRFFGSNQESQKNRASRDNSKNFQLIVKDCGSCTFFSTETFKNTRGIDVFHGYRLIYMDIHGDPWISMDIHGYPLVSMDIHGAPRISIYGYPWISFEMHARHGDPWVSIDIH